MIRLNNIPKFHVFSAVMVGFAVIAGERLLRVLWRLLSFIFMLSALWVSGVDAVFGLWSEVLLSIVFFCGIIYFFLKDIKTFHFPSLNEVHKRIEKDSELLHRPLSSCGDVLVTCDSPRSLVLWKIRNLRIKNRLIGKLKTRFDSRLSGHDRYALRFLSLMSFVLAVIIFTSNGLHEKIYNGIFPVSIEDTGFYEQSDIIVNVVYPEYTGLDKKIITASELKANDFTLKAPIGSQVKFSVSGGIGHPVAIHSSGKEKFKKVSDNSFLFNQSVAANEDIVIKQFFLPKFIIKIQAIKDSAPFISMVSEPEITNDGSIKFQIKLKDDYRVEKLEMSMKLDDEKVYQDDIPVLGTVVYDTKTIMSKPGQEVTIRPLYDLTYHPWAGLPVNFSFRTLDGKGNYSMLVTANITLPERSFKHPFAEKIVYERKRLIFDPEQARQSVMGELYVLHDALASQENSNNTINKSLFLALKLASLRLYMLPNMESYTEISSLLWDTAMSLEGGNLSIAMKTLQEAFKALEQALNDPTSTPAEISHLASQLQKAMNEYMLRAAMEMQKRAESGQMNIMSEQAIENMLDPYSMQAFIDQMKAEAMSGNKDRAMEMLSGMQRMMESMSQTEQIPEDLKNMYETYQNLNEILEEQINLAKKTEEKPDNYHGEQEQIRQKLKSIMERAEQSTGAIPSNMDSAEREMWKSGSLMLGGAGEESIGHQENAIKHLQSSMQDMKQMIGQKLKQMNMKMLSFETDPFGNQRNSGQKGKSILGEEITIPDESQRKRVNEILDILRKKSGELYRPAVETDYFRNLLKQF